MPFQIPVVEKCPIVKATQGLIEIEPRILGWLAGAVKDKNEWMVLLLGTRSEGGLHIIVDNIYVPPTQHRESSHVTPYKDDLPEPHEEFPEWVLARLVGNFHSHNSMGAKFSGGDLAPDGVCSTFSMSIVGSTRVEKTPEFHHLGFAYQAIGQFDLPCGALGTCTFAIIPRGVENWPHEYEVIKPLIVEGQQHTDLGDCDEYKESEDSDVYEYRREAQCGLVESSFNTKFSVFGRNGSPILSKLPPPYDPKKDMKNKWKGEIVRIQDDYRRDDHSDDTKAFWDLCANMTDDEWEEYLKKKYDY